MQLVHTWTMSLLVGKQKNKNQKPPKIKESALLVTVAFNISHAIH